MSIKKLFDKAWMASEQRSWQRGLLGAPDGTIQSPARAGFVYIRISREGQQSVTLAKHLGRIPFRYNLPIRARLENGVFVIGGVDDFYYGEATSGDTSNNFGVVTHTHSLSSGLTYLIESQRMQPGLVRPNGGWTISIEPARYYSASTWQTYLGLTALSLLGNRPSTTGKHRLVVITIDPATNLTAVVNGSDQNYATSLTQADIDAVSIGDKIPLAAVLMRADDTTINIQARYIDARGWLNIGGGATTLAGLTDTQIISPTTGQMLYYDSVAGWYNDDAPIIPQNLEDLSDVSFTTLADGDLFAYDSGTGDWVNIDPATVGGTGVSLITDWSYRENSSLSTSAFSWKGNRFTPDKDVDIYALCYYGTIVANGVYQAAVITGTATPGNVNNVEKSAAHTVGASPASLLGAHIWLEFDPPVSLTAGTQYGLMVGRTDGADNYQLPVAFDGGTSANVAVPMPGLSHGNGWRVADASLDPGSTIDQATGNAMACGFRFRFPDSSY